VATGAAAIAATIGSLLGWQARRGGARAAPAVVAIATGLAIPGPLVGAALIAFLNHDLPPDLPLGNGAYESWLLMIYDETPLAPMIAQAFRALPLTTLIAWHSFATLDRDVLAAAAMAGLSPCRVFWKIAIRQRRPALLLAALAAFAIAAGDLAWAHLVTPPGLDLVSRRVFGLVHSGVEEQVAAICLCMMAIYAAATGLVMYATSPNRKRGYFVS
jgi:iron(III) transport system permease protein